MILTAKQVEALDVGTTMGRLADLKNLLFIMDRRMNSIGKPIAVSTIWKPSGMNCPCITHFCGASLKPLTSHKLNCWTQQRHWMH